MIIEDVFKEFAEIVDQNRKYEISLLDKDGFVVQSTLPKMNGTQINDLKDDLTHSFYHLDIDRNDYGILMVQSDDDNLQVIAPLLHDALVTRIRFEIQQQSISNKMSNGDRLVRMLIDSAMFDVEKVIKLCQKLAIKIDCGRFALVLINDEGFTRDSVSKLNLIPYEENTFYSVLNPNRLVIFKSIDENIKDDDIHHIIKNYLSELEKIEIKPNRCFVSMPIWKIHEYHIGYEYCQWLEYRSNIKGSVLYFSDHLYEYFLGTIKESAILPLIDNSSLKKKNIDKDELINIAQYLIDADFSINRTAQELFLHKNTLLYKLKKYEDVFHLNITGSMKGRMVFTLIALSLRNEKRKESIGY